MILAFSGDPFLTHRAARRTLRDEGFSPDDVVEQGDGLDPDAIPNLAAQGGLFGRTALLLDFAAAFQGSSGVAPRKAAMTALAGVPDDATIVVIDPSATTARQKAWRSLGKLEAAQEQEVLADAVSRPVLAGHGQTRLCMGAGLLVAA